MKASENEIFFVEDDVEPNTEGQFNDIPTKLELRTNDLCTHLINKSLLKEFILIFWGKVSVYLLHVLGEISGILPDFTLKILGALMLTPSHLTHAHFIYYVRGTRRVPIMGTRRPFGPLSPYGHP